MSINNTKYYTKQYNVSILKSTCIKLQCVNHDKSLDRIVVTCIHFNYTRHRTWSWSWSWPVTFYISRDCLGLQANYHALSLPVKADREAHVWKILLFNIYCSTSNMNLGANFPNFEVETTIGTTKLHEYFGDRLVLKTFKCLKDVDVHNHNITV